MREPGRGEGGGGEGGAPGREDCLEGDESRVGHLAYFLGGMYAWCTSRDRSFESGGRHGRFLAERGEGGGRRREDGGRADAGGEGADPSGGGGWWA